MNSIKKEHGEGAKGEKSAGGEKRENEREKEKQEKEREKKNLFYTRTPLTAFSSPTLSTARTASHASLIDSSTPSCYSFLKV